jgi:hypothetical protein
VIADLLGKTGHMRTVPIPMWVKTAIDEWNEASGITKGAIFRSINKAGRVWGKGMTAKALWQVVRDAASRAGIAFQTLLLSHGMHPCLLRCPPDF